MPSEKEKAPWRRQWAAIREKRMEAARARFRRSKLDRFRVELEDLRDRGASLVDLSLWLSSHKRTRVHPSTIGKRLQKWQTDDGDEQAI